MSPLPVASPICCDNPSRYMLTRTDTARNHGLDFIKGIAACLIVFAHVPFPRPFGVYVAYLSTVSVSVFFMVSGYFSSGASRQKLWRGVKRTFTYLLVADVLYLIKMLIDRDFDFQSIFNFLLDEVFTLEHLLKTVVISQSKICFVAWFLIALLVCYVMRLLLGKRLRILGIIGFVVGVVVSLPPIDTHMDFPVSNAWLWGIPFFTLGEWVREHETQITDILERRLLVGICLLGLTVIVVSRYCGTQWWFVGNWLLAPALFLLFIRSGMPANRFCLLGSTYVFFIYIMHPLVSACYHAVRGDIGVVESWLRPLIVLVATVLLAAVYYAVKSLIVARVRH